jgi:hypothetical protein
MIAPNPAKRFSHMTIYSRNSRQRDEHWRLPMLRDAHRVGRSLGFFGAEL